MSGILVYSERDDLTHDLLAWAVTNQATFGAPRAVVLGENAQSRAKSCRAFGPEQVFFSADPALADLLDETIAQALAQVVEQTAATLVLIGATRRGRSLAPRLAQAIGAGCISEAVSIQVAEGKLIAGRNSLGGNTISTEVIKTPRQVIAVVPGTVLPAEPGDPTGEVIPLDLHLSPPRARVTERRPKPPTSVDITASERLVCIGRGLEKKDDLPVVERFAAALGGEVACSRPLSYEYDWLPEDRMIGISGNKCSPRLLFSAGVSGQVQHTVGIRGAKIIVAINTDSNAPIFNLSDYGLVGDLYEILPMLTEQLEQKQ